MRGARCGVSDADRRRHGGWRDACGSSTSRAGGRPRAAPRRGDKAPRVGLGIGRGRAAGRTRYRGRRPRSHCSVHPRTWLRTCGDQMSLVEVPWLNWPMLRGTEDRLGCVPPSPWDAGGTRVPTGPLSCQRVPRAYGVRCHRWSGTGQWHSRCPGVGWRCIPEKVLAALSDASGFGAAGGGPLHEDWSRTALPHGPAAPRRACQAEHVSQLSEVDP